MIENSNEPPENDNDQSTSDEGTNKKISKHLSDIDDTISEEDIKNVKVIEGEETPAAEPDANADKKNDNLDLEGDENKEEPKKEMPTSWDILT